MSDPGTHDDRWLAAVREALNDTDRVPRRVLEAAYAAFAWRTIDAELAELTYDSRSGASLAGTRSQNAPLRSMTFASTTVTIEVEIEPTVLLGQIVPSESGSLLVIRQDGVQESFEVDDLGCFAIEPIPTVPFRIQLAGQFSVATDWITL